MTECSIERFSEHGDQLDIPDSAELSAHTTFRIGGPAHRFVVARTEQELTETVRDCDDRGEPVLVLGGGSNMLVSDEGFPGTVVRVAMTGLKADVSACGGAAVRVMAGHTWDWLVAYAIEHEFAGVEMLSGIPGSVGATAIQNVGAYGAEVAQSITFVRTWDRQEKTQKTFPLIDCGFGYRTSRFKQEAGRYVILEIGFQWKLGSLGAPVAYPELAEYLGVQLGERVEARRVREAVLAIRGRKAMVLDGQDHDTWSAGSFFTNPLLTPQQAAALPVEAPRWQAGEHVKTSAAWLIQHAGFDKGFGDGPARLSTRHVLALTNRGAAQAADVVDLARQIRDGVQQRFGVTLVPEVNLIGVEI